MKPIIPPSPCPFCGREPVTSVWKFQFQREKSVVISCAQRAPVHFISVQAKTENKAIRLWNRLRP